VHLIFAAFNRFEPRRAEIRHVCGDLTPSYPHHDSQYADHETDREPYKKLCHGVTA
jgi:hypothetical protein